MTNSLFDFGFKVGARDIFLVSKGSSKRIVRFSSPLTTSILALILLTSLLWTTYHLTFLNGLWLSWRRCIAGFYNITTWFEGSRCHLKGGRVYILLGLQGDWDRNLIWGDGGVCKEHRLANSLVGDGLGETLRGNVSRARHRHRRHDNSIWGHVSSRFCCRLSCSLSWSVVCSGWHRHLGHLYWHWHGHRHWHLWLCLLHHGSWCESCGILRSEWGCVCILRLKVLLCLRLLRRLLNLLWNGCSLSYNLPLTRLLNNQGWLVLDRCHDLSGRMSNLGGLLGLDLGLDLLRLCRGKSWGSLHICRYKCRGGLWRYEGRRCGTWLKWLGQ